MARFETGRVSGCAAYPPAPGDFVALTARGAGRMVVCAAYNGFVPLSQPLVLFADAAGTPIAQAMGDFVKYPETFGIQIPVPAAAASVAIIDGTAAPAATGWNFSIERQ